MTRALAQLERRPWLVPIILAALTLGFFSKVVFTPGAVLVGDDLRNFFYPLFTFVARAVRDGQLPLWNPHLFGGVSVVADPEIAMFYPPNWLVLPLGVERGMTLLLVLHVWWAGWGMSKLARSLGASALGGLFAGATYAFSGWLVAQVWAGHYTLAQVASWLPWTLLAYHHALRQGGWRAALPGVAALGLTTLAGYPPLMIHLALLLFAVGALHVLTAKAWRPALWLAMRQLALMGVGGAVLAAVQLLPVAEFTQFSTRASLDLEFAGSFPLPGAQVLTLAFPNLLGSPARPELYWGNPFYEELMGYAGLWGLAALFLALPLREAPARLTVATAGLGAILSLGLHGGLLVVLLRWLPFFQLFRVPGRYLYLVVFAAAIASGLVVTRLQASNEAARRDWIRPAWQGWIPVVAVLALVAAVIFRLNAADLSADVHEERFSAMASSMAWGGLVLLGVGASLWLWSRRRGSDLAPALALIIVLVDLGRVGQPLLNTAPFPPASALWAEIADAVPADDPTLRVMPLIDQFWEQNGAAASGHYNVFGYESLEMEATTQFVALSDAPTAANNRLLGARYLVTTPPVEALNLEGTDALEPVSSGDYFIYESETALPRAFLVSDYEVIPQDGAARARLMERDFDPARTVILDEEPPCKPPGADGEAAIRDYAPNHVSVSVTNDEMALLLLTDQWYPGWTATMDGEATPVLRANTIFRAVCVPPGAHTITFRFRPPSFRWGATLSALGWAGLALIAVIPFLRRVILPSGD